jgi:hemerythrin HHE cation binding domain-containing protein
MPVTPRPYAPSPRGAIPLGSTVHAFAAQVGAADPTAVRAVLEPLRVAFAQHRAETEGAAGIYADVVQDAPRLARAVDGLVAEHECIDAAMERLALFVIDGAEDEAVRDQANEVLDTLLRHGRRDAELVHEAYVTDIGGE